MFTAFDLFQKFLISIYKGREKIGGWGTSERVLGWEEDVDEAWVSHLVAGNFN